MKKIRFVFFSLFLMQSLLSEAASVDSTDVYCAAMKKTYKAAVVLPASYAKNKGNYPVLYLLHGGGGHFRDWLTSTPDKMLVKNLANQYSLIIVMPEGETFSWYLNSSFNKESQFVTYVTTEFVGQINSMYQTAKNSKGRVITGLSMGGHGAFYLSTLHTGLYYAAGSISGALDMNWTNWKIPPQFATGIKQGYQSLVGDTTKPDLYVPHSVVNMADKMKTNALKVIIDCGVDDFLIEPNRELNPRLLYNHTAHDYTERPGGHTWDYWQNSLPYYVMFLLQNSYR